MCSIKIEVDDLLPYNEQGKDCYACHVISLLHHPKPHGESVDTVEKIYFRLQDRPYVIQLDLRKLL